jgi:Mrp family chromosome partitioning ATPase
MGKFLEALRRPATPRPPQDELVRLAVVPNPTAEDAGAEEEIPFIEVGPNRSMEASASVLAAGPAPAPHPPQPPPLAAEGEVTLRPSPPEALPRRPHFAPDVIAHHHPDHPISGQYRELLGCVTQPVAGEAAAVLLLTPALPDADASGVLLNLAVTAARQGGRRVLVVDADLRRPTLAERLGLAARPGLSDVLGGAVTLEQALQPTGQSNLAALTAGGPTPPGPRLVVETPASLLRNLRQCCGLALVLGPPWDGRPDAAALAAACDVVYLVLSEADAGSPKLDELLCSLPHHGARLGGCILAA